MLSKMITFNWSRKEHISFISLSDLSSYLFAAFQGFHNHRLFGKAKIMEKSGFYTCQPECILDMDCQKLVPFFLYFQRSASQGGVLCGSIYTAAWTYFLTEVMVGKHNSQGQHRLITISSMFCHWRQFIYGNLLEMFGFLPENSNKDGGGRHTDPNSC